MLEQDKQIPQINFKYFKIEKKKKQQKKHKVYMCKNLQ